MMIGSQSYKIEAIQAQSLEGVIQSPRGMRLYKSQQGSTLISVLLILLVITVLGVMAMRQGLTTLNISTNAQVKQLLVQSADAALNDFGLISRDNLESGDNVIGLALADLKAGVFNQEYVFCVRPNSIKGVANSFDSITIRAGSGDTPTVLSNSGGPGFCDLTTDFGSARRAVVTQVSVSLPVDAIETGNPGDYLPRGSNATEGQQKPTVPTRRVRATSTSMLPAFTNSAIETVQNTCIGNVGGTVAGRISDNTQPDLADKETLLDCLARFGVPASTQVTEFNLTSTEVEVTPP